VELRIAQTYGNGSFFPANLELRRRIAQAVTATQ
jgi:hypothetical protein